MDNLKKKNVKPKLLVLLKAHRGNNNNDAWMLVLNKLSILEQFGWQVIKHESWSRGLPYYHLSSNHSFTRSHVNIGHRFRKSRNLRIATDIWQFLRRLKVPQTLKAPTEPWLKLNSLQNDRYISANLRSPQSLMGLTVPCICICFLKRGGVRTDESCPVTIGCQLLELTSYGHLYPMDAGLPRIQLTGPSFLFPYNGILS